MTCRPIHLALLLIVLVSCEHDEGYVRKGAHTASGMLRNVQGTAFLSDCEGQLTRLAGELPSDVRVLVDSIGRYPAAVIWLELDGNDQTMDPVKDLVLPGKPFAALGILHQADSIPCAQNWVGSYYDTHNGRAQGKSLGKLSLMEGNEFIMTVIDPSTAISTTFKGRWSEDGDRITLKNDTTGFVFEKAGPRRLSMNTTLYGTRLEFERD